MAINFKNMEAPKQSLQYVKPGFWKLAPISAELVKAKEQGKYDYLSITFEGEAGKLVDKFYLSDKAGFKLKDLHKALYNKDLEKEFATTEEVATYFTTLFDKKKIDLNLIVGGERSDNGKVYARLHFPKFIGEGDFVEGPVAEGTTLWKDMVKENSNNLATTSPIVGETGKDEWPF